MFPRYEMKNTEIYDSEQHREYMLLLFDQCLCCFRHHPEVWVSLAQFEQRSRGVAEARVVFREALEVIPGSEMLRVADADLEEQYGTLENAKELLRTAFAAMPSSFIFTAYQAFLRRNEGVAAARRAFSEYIASCKQNQRALDVGVSVLSKILRHM